MMSGAVFVLLSFISGVGSALASTHEVVIPAQAVWQMEQGVEVVRWPGLSRFDDARSPSLPYYDVTVLLAPGQELTDVQAVPLDIFTHEITGDVAQGAALVSSEGLTAIPTSAEAGEMNFPATWGQSLGTTTWHGFQLAHVRLYPVRLQKDHELKPWARAEIARNFTIEIQSRPTSRTIAQRMRPRLGEDMELRVAVSDRIINPARLGSYPRLPATNVNKSVTGYLPTDAPSLDGSPVDFLIITNDELASSFQSLADYRTGQGMPTVIRTMEWISANFISEESPQATLRSFLTEAYSRWGVRWVLLGGDVDIIPTQMIFSTYYPAQIGSDLPVDLYYAGLDGNWNADGDELLAEPYHNAYAPGDDADLVPELIIGRAPVSSSAAVDVFVSKILDYERDQSGEHLGRTLFMSEVLFPSAYTAGMSIDDDGASYSETIVDSVLAGTGMAYDRYYEANDLWPGSIAENKTSVINALNSGSYGIVNHIGHGYFYNMSVGASTLDVKDANALVNGTNYFLLNNLNCASAAFDLHSIMERFVTNANGGAVSAIGSSRAAFPTTAGEYQLSFFQSLFEQGHMTAGGAMTASRTPFDSMTLTNSVQRWTHLALTLVGDPTLRLATAAPETLSLTMNSSIDLGGDLISVDVSRLGLPVEGATVCLWKDGEDYVVGTTDSFGHYESNFNALSAGEVKVGVTSVNDRPAEAMINAIPAASPLLVLNQVTLIDDGTQGSQGNGDGMPDAGEIIALQTQWINEGGGPSLALGQCDVVVNHPGVTVLSGPITLPTSAAGAIVSANLPLLLQLDPFMSDHEEIMVDLAALADGQTSQNRYDFEVFAPVIEPGIMGWNDFPYGNGNGIMEANEEIRLWLSLQNTGWGSVEGLTAWIDTSDPNVTVTAGLGTWADAGRFEEVTQDQEFRVSMVSASEFLDAVLHIVDSYGREWIHQFTLTLPARPTVETISATSGDEVLLIWEPNSEADLLGYHVERALAPSGPYERLSILPLVDVSFYRDTNLSPLTTYYYRMMAIDESRFLSRPSDILSVSTPPAEQSGFPIAMEVETSSHVAVGDIDGDGELDIVSAADAIYVWTAGGEELRDGDNDPLTLGPFIDLGETWTPAGVTLGNVTTSPGLEIIASCRSNKSIYVFQSDGSVAPGWPQLMSNWNWATPSVGDLDQDGDLEIIVTSVDGRTYAWHHDGTELYDGDADPGTNGVFHIRPNEWYSYCSAALADIDNDGNLEVIISTKRSDQVNDVLHALKIDTSEAPGFPVDLGLNGSSLGSPAVADMDQDGFLEIVLITEDDNLYVINHDGSFHSPFPVPFVSQANQTGQSSPSPALGDFDQDGRLDMVVVSTLSTTSAEMFVYDLDGNVLSGWPRSLPGSSESSPIVGDVTGDGGLDIIFGIGGGSDSAPNNLYIFRTDGSQTPGFPLTLAGPVRPSPALADIDLDGDIDLIYAGWDLAAHIWDFPADYDPALVPWPTFHANPQRTGLFLDSTISTAEPESSLIPTILTLEQNVPNPFNPSTLITFGMPGPDPSRVRLQIFDMRGHLVRTLVNGTLPAGRHEVSWHGQADSGRAVASGVYLYRLDNGGNSVSGRMTLVR